MEINKYACQDDYPNQTYWAAFDVNYFIKKPWFPIKKNKIQKGTDLFNKYGKWSLLFSWVPIIGDPIAFAAGTVKYNITFFLIFVSIGKIARYLIIYLYLI